MADLIAITNGVGASQEQPIDLEDSREASPDINIIAESGLQQPRNLDVDPATSLQEDDSALQLNNELGDRSFEAESAEGLFVSSSRDPSESASEVGVALYEDVVRRDGIAVIVPPLQNRWEYRRYEEEPAVVEILEEYNDGGMVEYLVLYDDENEEVVSSYIEFFLHTRCFTSTFSHDFST